MPGSIGTLDRENWSQVSVYPSPSFLSKDQLAWEGPDSVALVVIPALAPTLDESLREDRSCCPVRALCYYLDRTKDLQTTNSWFLSLLRVILTGIFPLL